MTGTPSTAISATRTVTVSSPQVTVTTPTQIHDAAEDADCDGLTSDADCDDLDVAVPADDMDCDGIPTVDDCDDDDATLPLVDASHGAHGDDCDDSDAILGSLALDADCDGTLTEEDRMTIRPELCRSR